MKRILLSSFLLFTLLGYAASELPTTTIESKNQLDLPQEWTEYMSVDGIKIEYKMKECGGDKMRAQNLLLFRFTNTTDQEVTISWVTKEFRNGECWNCDRIDNLEFAHALTLDAGEVIEGDGTTKENKEVYIFGNYIKFVPGMIEQTLTNVEFINVVVH